MYCTWKLSQLKAELRKRGASCIGTKEDLVERLEADDRNCNFADDKSNPLEVEPIPIQDHRLMVIPTDDFFKDIDSSTSLPPLDLHEIQEYFGECSQSMKIGKRLYENRYLRILRAVQIDDFIFIKGFCKASRKGTQYEINIKVHQNGILQGSNCECIAGSGIQAQCKHVAIVLYAVLGMLHHKIVLLDELSTEKLQSKVKNSTPLKAENLYENNLNFHPYQGTINREEYNEKIRKLVLNFKDSTMPLKQLYRPANPCAVELDHGSYSSNSSKDDTMESL